MRMTKAAIGLLVCGSISQAGEFHSIEHSTARAPEPLNLDAGFFVRAAPGRVHTDVPELPGRSVMLPDRTYRLLDPGLGVSTTPGAFAGWEQGAQGYPTAGMLFDWPDPIDWGGFGDRDGRPVVHTDVPDLPPFEDPPLGVSDAGAEGVIDWYAGVPGGPDTLSATIPTPSTLLSLGLVGCLAARRRRRG